ncbi:response regulator [Rhodovulum viride]|nr:response regulator [Rhodovulum viride]
MARGMTQDADRLGRTPLNLLIVEDDDGDAKAVRRALNRSQIEATLTRAVDGVEALSIMRGVSRPVPASPYIVLADIRMPRMNGLEFLRELRNDRSLRQVVVFVLTTSNDDDDKRIAYEAGISGYILKQKAGRDFASLIETLDRFWNIVSFPDIRLSED